MALIKVGKISDAHGLRGEIKVRFISDEPIWIDKLKKIYLPNTPSQTPDTIADVKEYQISNIRFTNEFWILDLDSVKDRTEAEALKNIELYLPKEFFETQDEEEPYMLELLNFKVILKNKVKGVIKDFMSAPSHELIVIETDNGKYTIPWVPDFILEVKRNEKAVIMDFPEDLLSEDFRIKE